MSQAVSAVDLPAAPPPLISFRSIVTPGLKTVRRFWKPILLIQICAILSVVGYYHVPAVAAFCQRLADWQSHGGLWFVAVTAGTAGSILPEVANRLVRRDARFNRRDLRNLIFTFCAFAFSGVFTSVQYRGEAWVYGSGMETATVVKKVLTDQFITTPIYGTPYWVVVYLWRRNRYRPLRTIFALNPRWYATDVLPLLVTGWFFWIPACSAIYSMPTSLQFVLFCFALAAWSLLMTFVADQPAPANQPA